MRTFTSESQSGNHDVVQAVTVAVYYALLYCFNILLVQFN